MILTQIRRNARVLLLLTGLLTGIAQADDMARAQQFLADGAGRLALQTLMAMPDPADAEQRLARYRLLWQALAMSGMPQEIVDQAGLLPADTDPELRRQVAVQAAQAALTLGQPHVARHYLRMLIWQLTPDAAGLPALRAMVVQSHLVPTIDDDAFSLWQRFVQDYGHDTDLDTAVALAELKAGRTAGLDSLRAGLKPGDRLARLLDACNNDLSPDVRRQALAGLLQNHLRPLEMEVLRHAMASAHDARLQTMLLEAGLNEKSPPAGMAATDLWAGWRDLAQGFGNVSLLLFGSDQGWAGQADKVALSDPLMSRAIWAHLAQSANDPVLRDQAARRLLDQLHKADLDRTAVAAFAAQWPGRKPEDYAVTVRWALGRAAFDAGRFDLADAMWRADLTGDSQDATVAWQWRRAMAASRAADWPVLAEAVAAWTSSVQHPSSTDLWSILFALHRAVAAGVSAQILNPLLEGMLPLADAAAQADILRERAHLASLDEAPVWYLDAASHASQPADAWQDRLDAAHALARSGNTVDALRIYQAIVAGCSLESLREQARFALQGLAE